MRRAAVLAMVLMAAAPVARVAAEDEAQGAEHGHAGPLHASDVVRNPEFWTAAINFTLLLFLLRRFGKKPVSEFLVQRRREMEQAMTEAAAMKQKAEAKYKEYAARLATLDEELSKLRSDIERGAQEDKRRIVAEAEETARRLKRETESLIEQHAKALASSVRRDMVDAAMVAAEQRLRAVLTEGDQQRLAEGYSQQVAGARAERPQPRSRPQEQP
jgi:F-type H+-transporting ATPase subunit b